MSIEPTDPDRRTILVLGGIASGKSALAESRAAALGRSVTYVATAEARDHEMRRRIALHRARRPGTWATLEATRDLAKRLEGLPRTDVVLVDSLGMLVANHMGPAHRRGPSIPQLHTALERELGDLTALCGERDSHLVLVSEEVGLGLVPIVAQARRFTELLGFLNQHVAATADEVILVEAGRPIPLPPAAAPSPRR
jgi:adenosylcobinamide kinase/adenosylcobinamide-phosphate guanylyltransferase